MVIGKVILFVLLVIAIGVGIKFVTGVDVSQSTNGGSFGVRIEPATTTPSTNYSTVNVNNSDYWDGLDTPADITYDEISGGDVNDLGYYGYFNGLGGVVGGLSMDGDPWWLSGTDFQIDQELEVDGDTYLSDTFPRTTLTYSLGSGALRWLNLFVQNVNAEEIDAFNLHLSENLTVDGYINGVNISNLDEDFVQYEGATANVNITNYNVTADDFFIPAMDGGGSYSSLNDAWNLFNSAGRISGGALTNPSGTNVVVEAGEGIFRIADDDVSQVKFGNWSASDPIAIATNTIKYIGVEWNGGSPQVISYDDDGEFDLDTEFPLGTVINQADTIYILNNPWWVGDGLTNVIERFQAQGWLIRDENMGGLVIGYTGTRALTMTSGTVWGRLVEFPISEFDSSGADTFNMYYQDGAGNFLEQSDLSQWNNTAWDDGGVLTTINNNQYSVLWVWLNVGADEPAIIYPQQTYSNVASAEAEEVPNTFPSYWSKGGILLGRIIVKQGVDAPIEVQSAFSQVFNPAQATDHGNLGGLGDDDHLQYWVRNTLRSENFSTTGRVMANKLIVNASTPLIQFYNQSTHTYDVGTTPEGTFAILDIGTTTQILKHDTTEGIQLTDDANGIKMISDGNIDFTDEDLNTTGNVNANAFVGRGNLLTYPDATTRIPIGDPTQAITFFYQNMTGTTASIFGWQMRDLSNSMVSLMSSIATQWTSSQELRFTTTTGGITFFSNNGNQTFDPQAEGFSRFTENVELDGDSSGKLKFGADQDAWMYWDGTNMIFNNSASGVYTFYNSTGLGTIRYGTALTSTTVETSEDALEDFVLGGDIVDDNGDVNHTMFGECYSVVEDTDYDNCWEVLDYVEYCTIVETTELCQAVPTDKDVLNWTIREHYRQDCGTKLVDVVDLTCLDAKQTQALALINRNFNLYENVTDIDTDLMVENLLWQSKPIVPNFDYVSIFSDYVPFLDKHTDPAYEEKIIGGIVFELRNAEEEIVNMKGYILQNEFCRKNNKKYDDYNACMDSGSGLQ